MVYLEKLIRKSPPVHLSSGLPTPELVSHPGSPNAVNWALLKTAGPKQPYIQQRRVYSQEANRLLPYFKVVTMPWHVLKTLGWGKRQCLKAQVSQSHYLSAKLSYTHLKSYRIVGGAHFGLLYEA